MSLELEKEKLEKKKKQLLLKEKLIKEKERQVRARRLVEIGKLAGKAEIDHLDEQVILGAFLEIAENLKEKRNLENWKQKAKAFLENAEESIQEPLIISFASNPAPEVKFLLRELNFKWNNFRKEFYGYGDRKSIEKALAGTEYMIDLAE